MQRLFAVLLIGAAIRLADPVCAGETESGARPLQVTIRQELAEYEKPYYSAYVTAGETKFTFIVPQDFRLKSGPDAERLVIGNTTGDSSISFAIFGSGSQEAEMTAEACRATALKLHPEGRILQEFLPRTIGKNGQGVDVEWKVAENLYQCERIACIPTQFGLFVFTATSGRKDFSNGQANLELILTTFRASTDGKFHPAHIQPIN